MGVQEGMKVYLDTKYQLWPSFPVALVGGYIIVSHNTDLYPNGVNKTATLTIDGVSRDTLNIHCEAYNMTERQFIPMHNTTLIFQG